MTVTSRFFPFFHYFINSAMITFKISFLLAIDKSKQPEATKKRAPKTPKTKKTKPMIPPKTENEDQEKNYTVIEIGQPVSCIHLRYDLFGKKFQYEVDVICWGPVAKIFTRDGCQSVKTFIKGDVVWIPVFVEHYLTELPNDEIRNMTLETINLAVSTGNECMGKLARSDRSAGFFLRENDACGYFPEVYEKRLTDQEIIKDLVERILQKVALFPSPNEIVSWIYDRNLVHSHNIARIITKRSNGEEAPCRDLRVEITETKDKPNKKKKRKKNDLVVKITAQVLLSDPLLATFNLINGGSNVKELFVLCSSENALTAAQKVQLRPLIVRVRKISCLPVDVLKENGFQEVFVSCDVPGVQEIETSRRCVDRSVRFDESRFIISGDVASIKILELLETRRVVAKIIGVKAAPPSTETTEEPKKLKETPRSSKTPKSSKILQTENVILAVATFDLNLLMQTYHFKEKAQCHNVRSHHFPTPKFVEHILDRITLNEIHFCNIDKNELSSPLSDDCLLVNGTTLKLEAHFLQPTFPLFYIKTRNNLYNRLLLILYNEQVAKDLLTLVLNSNSAHLSSQQILFPNSLVRRETCDDEDLEARKVLSGFFLDDGNTFIFYVEGLVVGDIQILFHKIAHYNRATAKVFHHSDYVYEEPLYPVFQRSGGIYATTLKLPLVEIFAQKEIYLEGSVPYHCFRTIQKLNLIVHSTTLHSVLSHDLLPTEVELISFSIEFCYQLRFKVTDLGNLEGKSKSNFGVGVVLNKNYIEQ